MSNAALDIARALAAACPGVRIESVGHGPLGHSSRQWLVTTDEGPLLVKVPTRLRDPEHSRGLLAATRWAGEAGVRTVRFRAFVPDCAEVGGPLVVQEFVEGETADALWDEFTDDAKDAVLDDVGDALAALRARPAAWFGDVLGHRRFTTWAACAEDFAARQLGALPAVDQPSPAVVEALDRRTRRVAELDVTPRLAHADMWPSNWLLRAGRVERVLDFEHAFFADPVWDLVKLDELVFEAYPAGRARMFKAVAADVGDDFARRFQLCQGLGFLFMLTWFAHGDRQWVGEYHARLGAWTEQDDE